MLSPKTIALALSSVAFAASNVLPSSHNQRSVAAFAAAPALPSLRAPIAAAQSQFVNALTRSDVSLEEVAVSGVQGVSMMSCRRNLKKEKRVRNEACARQFRKAPKSRFRGRGGGPGNAARQAQDNSDNEWLAQIYGQHTIYRRDEGAAIVNAKAEASEVKEPVAA